MEVTTIATILKVAGAMASALGSILLAWRVRKILKWVVYCLVAHEQSIVQLRKLSENNHQTDYIVHGVTSHLLEIQEKAGVVLLVLGFAALGLGMLCNAATYIIAAAQ